MSAHRWHRPGLRKRILAGDEPEWLLKHPRRAYVRQAVLATPPWVNIAALKKLAARRDYLTGLTGVVHVLDHVTPLNHPRICGLNVAENIRVIPKASNARKSNAWCEWHGELFDSPEQFRLFL